MWSSLNSISPTVRTATLAHREEVLDDHACDANHKKMLNIHNYLCQRYKESTVTLADFTKAFKKLSMEVGPPAVSTWQADIEMAEANRTKDRKVMDLYAAKGTIADANRPASAPSKAPSAIEAWVDFALAIEEKQ
jgi:hypothetical protein